MAGNHPPEPARSVLVGPSTSNEFNTVKAAIFPIACWRVDDVRFEFDSSFVTPDVADEMTLLAKLVRQHTRDDQKPPASVFGHADPVGDDHYNKQLSGRRAQAIYALLTRDTALWEDLYSHQIGNDKWGVKSIQTMLKAVGHDPGAIDGVQGQKTTAAIKSFQQANGLAVDGVAGPQTRAKLFLAYMDAICKDEKGNPFKLEKTDFLAQGTDKDGKGDYQGCSEFNPVLLFSQLEEQEFSQSQNQSQRNAENAPNRRVVVFLFRVGSRVSAERWPCPRAKEGVGGCKKRFWSDGEQRRSKRLPEQRRKYEETKDTFACRFYDRISVGSPCEGFLASSLIIECVTWDGWKAANARYVIVDQSGKTLGLGDENFRTNEQGQVKREHIPSGAFTLFVFPPEKVSEKDSDFNVVYEYIYNRKGREFKVLKPDPNTDIKRVPYGESVSIPDAASRKARIKIVCDLSLVVLQPALGFPGSVKEGSLDVVVLTTKAVAALNKDVAQEFFLSCLRSQPWDKEAKNWSKTSLRWEGDLTKFASVEAEGTGELKPDGKGVIKELLARLSSKVMEAYQPWEINTVFRIRFKMPDGETKPSNLINLQGEDVALHLVLRDTQSKYWSQDWPMFEAESLAAWPADWPQFKGVGKKNAGFHTGLTNPDDKGDFIKLYHPFFSLGDKADLSVAHVTDVHTSTRWELFAQKGKPFNHYNERFTEIYKDATQRADITILTGDLIDFNRGLNGAMIKGQQDDLTKYIYNANWLLFYNRMLKDYEKPSFTVLGNHDYLPNPYPQFMTIKAKLLFITVKDKTVAFENDLNLLINPEKKINEVEEFVKDSQTEHFFKEIGALDAKKLIEAMDASDHRGADAMIKQHAPDMLTRASGPWHISGDAATWYFLVMNPFSDYHVAHKDLSFLMLDWGDNGDAYGLILLPRPEHCISPEQLGLLKAWLDREARIRTLCLHSPVAQPTEKMGNWFLKQRRLRPHTDENGDVRTLLPAIFPPATKELKELCHGTIEDNSQSQLWAELLRRSRAGKFPLHIVLAGHSHANKVLTLKQMDRSRGILFLHKRNFDFGDSNEDFQFDPTETTIIITTSGGPIGVDEDFAARAGSPREPMTELVPPGYRLVKFSAKVDAFRIFPSSIKHQDIRPAVRDQAVGGHFIKEFKTSQSFDKSAIICEVTSNATIKDVSDGVTVGIKKIREGVTLKIENNDGTIVILENKGKLVVEDNDDILRVEDNFGQIEIQQNDDDIAVQRNLGSMVIFNSRPRISLEQTEVNDVFIFENSGSIRIESNTGGVIVRSTVFIKRNLSSGRVDINKNDDHVTIGVNEGVVQVNNNDDTVELGDNQKQLNIVFNASGVLDDADILVKKMSGAGAIVIQRPGNKGNLLIPKGQRSKVTVMPGAATGDIDEKF